MTDARIPAFWPFALYIKRVVIYLCGYITASCKKPEIMPRSEIEIIKAVDDALSELADDDARRRVLAWADAKYSGNAFAPAKRADPTRESKSTPRAAPGKRRKSKAKGQLKQIKDLDLRPNGKESARAFVEKKKPTNVKQKCVVALYYLLYELELDKAGVNHVYTVFKDVGWPAPADLLNTLHQAGSKGWLDTADSEDLKITPTGENLVEHDLPKT